MLRIAGLTKAFPPTRRRGDRVLAVDDLSLHVEEGQLFTLLGPSGCGKSTTLRCVAGLEHPDQGEITLGQRVLFSSAQRIRLPANQRGLGMVFQSYAIWPHMNVFDNVAFPLRVLPRARRPSKAELTERVERVLQVVQLDQMADRPATNLSGGQQQRLALARALVNETPMLLLDEPLSNLDAKLREGMRFELKRLQRELGITAIYVTHDQLEALAMSSKIAVMNQGRIEQVGTPREVYEKPNSQFVANFVGTSNLFEGTIEGTDQGGYAVRTPTGLLTVRSPQRHTVGDKVLVVARPERIEIRPGAGASPGAWSGVVMSRAFLGEAVDHLVSVGTKEIRVRTNPNISIPQGTEVGIGFPPDGCSLITLS